MLDDRDLIRLAILEDLGTGDVTTESVLRESHTSRSHARLIAREGGVLSGSGLVRLVFEELKSDIEVDFNLKDGEEFHDGSVIASLRGDPRDLLAGERLALNLLSRMSGSATHTRMLVKLIANYSTELLDTRKTTPLWRKWEKRAVLHGGGVNHRMGLYDQLLIKDNHIKAAGGIERAIESARDNSTPIYKLEVEIARLGLSSEEFTIRMTGCPNGCARPYNCDIGLVGKTVGKYTVLLGGRLLGDRLNTIYKDLVPADDLVSTLLPVLINYKENRLPHERLGDFCHRQGSDALLAWSEAYAEQSAG